MLSYDFHLRSMQNLCENMLFKFHMKGEFYVYRTVIYSEEKRILCLIRCWTTPQFITISFFLSHFKKSVDFNIQEIQHMVSEIKLRKDLPFHLNQPKLTTKAGTK